VSKVETRAQALGVKPRRLESKTRRALAKVRIAIEGLSLDWSEIDGGIEQDLQAAYDKIREIDGEGGTLAYAIERLAEPWGDAP
jgi:hypothetical protein